MKNPPLLLLLIPLWMSVLSCKQQADSSALSAGDAFANHIQAHTDGVIAAADPLVILFRQPLNGYEPGDELPDDLISLSPGVAGKTFLTSQLRLEFVPDKPLGNGKSYTVELDLSRIFAVPDDQSVFRFEIQVVPLDFTFLEGRLMRDPADPDTYRYEGLIQCSDRMDAATLEALFEVNGDGSGMVFSLENHSPDQIRYRLSGITRKTEEYHLQISWNGRRIGMDERGEQQIRVPGSAEFSILGVYPEQGEHQMVRVLFSNAPDGRQNLEGLIRFDGDAGLSTEVAGDEIRVYPVERLEGEWTLQIDRALRSAGGVALEESRSFVLAMSPLPPEVALVGSGYILPDAGGLFLPFKTVSMRGVDLYVYKVYANNLQQFLQQNDPQADYSLRGTLKYVGRPVYRKTIRLDQDPSRDLSQWNTWTVDLSPLVESDPHALYHVEFRLRPNLAHLRCGETAGMGAAVIELLPETFSEDDLAGYTDSHYHYEDLYPADYDWQQRDNPCHVSYYHPGRFVHTNILATNLGIVAKSGNQKDFLIVVSDLLTADPVGNASVQFYNFQQQQILAGMTDQDGMLEVKLSEVPYLVTASAAGQTAWLKLEEGASLSLSNFDVSGAGHAGGVRGLLYGERGVWRPGDTLHLSFALFDKAQTLPDDIPVLLEISDPRDHVVYKSSATRSLNEFYVFQVPTRSEDPTGDWNARVTVGGLQFEKRLKIEEVRPNRIKMDLQFDQMPLRAEDAEQELRFRAEWLHGAPAGNMRAEVQVRLQEQTTRFESWSGFTFSNPLRQYWPDEYLLFNDLLDEQGEKTIPVYLPSAAYAPGMLRAVFTSRVFEQGGSFSTDVHAVDFSPFRRYVGLAVSGAANGVEQLVTDTVHQVQVVTVRPDGQLTGAPELIARVYKLNWSWWWSADPGDLASYIGSEYEQLVYETRLHTREGKGAFSFRINYPDWGRYLVHVTDPESGHAAGEVVYVDWPSWVARDGRANPSGASMLTFTADREVYEPGQKARLTFPSMKNGRALLTVEAGDRILEARWVATDEPETQTTIEITGDMAPNIYASITLVQPHDHPGNDLPIRQYGVLRIPVDHPGSHLNPDISLPEEIRPGDAYSVRISEASGHPMTYTLAIVDEGLLNLTRFKTPDPWQLFYAREALGVHTWDAYDAVIGAFGGRLESLLAIGGDEGEIQADAAKANRFRPVVSFHGPFELRKNKTRSHELTMPNYVGQVRAMVIAGSGEAWGSAESYARVRQPLMVLTALPRRLASGDEVQVPVSVFVMDDQIREVTVSLSTDGPLGIQGASSQTLRVDGAGEYLVSFAVQAAQHSGWGQVTAGAIAGKEAALDKTDLEVVNPNPYLYQTDSYLIEPGDQQEMKVLFHGRSGTNSSTLTVSGLPSGNLHENLGYLIRYPYGCLEQITSSAFAQLMLGDLAELSEARLLQTDQHVRETLRKLISFQLPSGGFSLWPGGSEADLWATSWAGHFILSAERKGYVVPGSLMKNWVRFQQARVNAFPLSSDDVSDSAIQQAYRLFTLAMAGYPDFAAMNRLRESETLSAQSAWRLAAAYALAGRMQAAEELIQQVEPTGRGATPGDPLTFGSTLRDQAMILETMVLMGQRKEAFSLAANMLTDLRVSRWNTQAIAYSLTAIARLTAGAQDAMLEFTLEQGGDKNRMSVQKSSWMLPFDEAEGGTRLTLTNEGSTPIYAAYTSFGQATDYLTSAVSSGLSMQVRYLDMQGREMDPGRIRQGASFVAEVTVRNPVENGYVGHLALSQVFPSGWEILSTRYADDGETRTESAYTYRDIRDDRVHTFFGLSGGQQAVFTIRLNAAYKGFFSMPGALCEDMYQPGRMATIEGRRVAVE